MGANKKYVPCILKYVRHISKYLRHIFCPLKTRLKNMITIRTKQRQGFLYIIQDSVRPAAAEPQQAQVPAIRFVFCITPDFHYLCAKYRCDGCKCLCRGSAAFLTIKPLQP